MNNDLRHEFGLLRGEPIALKGKPEDIPCIETSDAVKLCRNPLVSVHMLAYNHGKYIAQAIESVLAQQTDFEYELVIGEDASPDNTREICFAYQKKHPDKIRVLWSEENVFKVDGNMVRTTAACRGEFIAICEGDDYWTDPLKLQKQVDVMRSHPNVGLCFCSGVMKYENTGAGVPWPGEQAFPSGEMTGLDFAILHVFGKEGLKKRSGTNFLLTASTLIRADFLHEAHAAFEVFNWKLLLSDTTTWLGLSMLSNAYYLPERVCVYRKCEEGITSSRLGSVCMDALLVRTYFILNGLHLTLRESGDRWCDNILRTCYARLVGKSSKECRKYLRLLKLSPIFSYVVNRLRSFPITLAMSMGLANRFLLIQFGRLYNRFMPTGHSSPRKTSHA